MGRTNENSRTLGDASDEAAPVLETGEGPSVALASPPIVDFLDMKDGWAGPGTFAPSRMIIRNARAFLSRVSAVNRIVPCVSPSPRGTINITYYLDEDRDISVEVGDDELASSTNLDRDDLFLVWNRDDAIPRQLLEALAQGRPLTRSWNSPSRGWSVR